MSGISWEETLSGRKIHCAVGERDVFIIAPGEELPGGSGHSDEVVPRRKTELSEEDRTKLSNQGVPEDCQEDDLGIMKTRFTNDNECHVVGEVSYRNPTSLGLTKVNVLKRIEIFLKTTLKPRGQLNLNLTTAVL